MKMSILGKKWQTRKFFLFCFMQKYKKKHTHTQKHEQQQQSLKHFPYETFQVWQPGDFGARQPKDKLREGDIIQGLFIRQSNLLFHLICFCFHFSFLFCSDLFHINFLKSSVSVCVCVSVWPHGDFAYFLFHCGLNNCPKKILWPFVFISFGISLVLSKQQTANRWLIFVLY